MKKRVIFAYVFLLIFFPIYLIYIKYFFPLNYSVDFDEYFVIDNDRQKNIDMADNIQEITNIQEDCCEDEGEGEKNSDEIAVDTCDSVVCADTQEIFSDKKISVADAKVGVVEDISELQDVVIDNAQLNDEIISCDIVAEKEESENKVLNILEKDVLCGQEQEIRTENTKCIQDIVEVDQGQIYTKKHDKKEDIVHKCNKQGVIFLGRLYNHSLVKPTTKRLVINASITHKTAYKAYDDCGFEVSLGKWLFDCFKIKDVFLFSKLADEGKICFTPDCVPISANIRENQYLAYMANYNVGICAERRNSRVDIGILFNFWLMDDYKLRCSIGFNLPIISRLHIMNLNFEGPDNKKIGFSQEQMKHALSDFHQRFDGISDFFCRAVLEPKNLYFYERQRELGIGDFFCFALFDLASFFCNIEGFQINVELTFPSGKKVDYNNIWGVSLGAGAYQFGLSAKMFYKTSRTYFNPLVSIGGGLFASYKSMRRIPKLIMYEGNENIPVEQVPCLIAPLNTLALDYKTVYTSSFSSFDSCISNFSDRTYCTCTKKGNIFELDIGNCFCNVFKSNFTANIFYEFTYQGKDTICIQEKGIYNTDLLIERTKIRMHVLSWDLVYMLNDGCIDIGIGSTHVLGGVNVRKAHAINVSLTTVF